MSASTPSQPTSPVVVGLTNIGRLFGRSRWTIKRWVDGEGFPAAMLPDRSYVTTLSLINEWILERAEEQEDEAE